MWMLPFSKTFNGGYMNTFKNLIIKILCCAIVCAAIIPDVYGMKRKADATKALKDSAEPRTKKQKTEAADSQNSLENQEPKVAVVQQQQPAQPMDTSNTSSQNASVFAPGFAASP